MKNTTIIERRLRGIPRIGGVIATALLIAAPVTVLADEEYEWEAGEGYHEEEWYDPTDWFNEDDATSYEYDYSYYNDTYWSDDSLTYDVWDYPDYDTGWADTYDYDYDDRYAYDNNGYYDWDPAAVEWVYISPGKASDRSSQADNRNQKNSAKSGDQRASGGGEKMASVTGRISGFKKADLRKKGSAPESTRLIKLTMKDDRSVVVNLGSDTTLDDLDLEKGDKVKIKGQRSTINKRPVLIAREITVDGEKTDVTRQNRNVTAEGKLSDYKVAQIDGTDHLVVKIDLKNNRDLMVDLGPDASLSDFDLQTGQRIKVRGTRTEIDGKSVIVANRVMIDGDKTKVRSKNSKKRDRKNF